MATMKLLPLVCLCVLTWSPTASGDENRPAVKVIVKEDSDAILPCSLSTGENIEVFDWKKDGRKEVFFYDASINNNNGGSGQNEQFKGRVSHFPDELKNGNASIIIRKTKVNDSGNYTCIFPRLQPERKFQVQLLVGAAPRPNATIHVTEDGLQLKCEVQGASPLPEVQWRDSAGKALSAEKPEVSKIGNLYHVTLLATVTKTETGRFRCVATQKEIHHETEDDVYIHAHNSGVQSPGSGQTFKVMIGVAVGVLARLLFL